MGEFPIRRLAGTVVIVELDELEKRRRELQKSCLLPVLGNELPREKEQQIPTLPSGTVLLPKSLVQFSSSFSF